MNAPSHSAARDENGRMEPSRPGWLGGSASPLRFFAVAAGSVFAIEILIMALLPLLPALPPLAEALVDSSLLTLLLLPVLYAVVVRPLTRETRQRRWAEQARGLLLEETAHGGSLLRALSRAAEAVLRARTAEAVYRAVGDEANRLGYQSSVFTLSEDRGHLLIGYLNFKPELVRAAEKLSGLSAQGYSFRIVPGGFNERVLAGGEAIFCEPATEAIAENLPTRLRPLAGGVAAALQIRQAIYAPLTVDGERFGLLAVTGSTLTEADVPAVTIFANQTAIALENVRRYQDALTKVRTLSGMLPICAHCKKVRDDTGYWDQIENYIAHRSEAEFSHGICPDCARELYPEHALYPDDPD